MSPDSPGPRKEEKSAVKEEEKAERTVARETKLTYVRGGTGNGFCVSRGYGILIMSSAASAGAVVGFLMGQ